MKYIHTIFFIIGCLFLACAPQESTTESPKVSPKQNMSAESSEVIAQEADREAENPSLNKLDKFLGELPPEIIKEIDIPRSSKTSATPQETPPPLPQFTPLSDPSPVSFQVQVSPTTTNQTLSQHEMAKKHGVKLNFDNASIYDVTKVVSEITGKSFIIDQKVEDDSRVTIFSEDLLSPNQVFELYKSVLELNGLAITQVGNFYKIVQTDDAQKRYIPVDSGTLPKEEDRLITQIVKLQHIEAQKVKDALSPMTSANIIDFSDPEKGDTLIITDLASNVRKILAVIKEIDVSKYANRYFQLFPITHADLLDLVNDLNQILSLQEIAEPTPVAQPTPTPSETPEAISALVSPDTKTRLYPILRLNALAVSTNNPEVIALVKKWIDILDQPSARGSDAGAKAGKGVLINHVYYVRYAKADELAPLLAQVYDDQITQPEEAPEEAPEEVLEEVQQQVTGDQAPEFIPERTTNSIIIRATDSQYAEILQLLEKLDHRPLQVLIDVIIAEILLDDSETLGVRGLLLGQDQVTAGGETNSIESTAETVFDSVSPDGAQGFLYTMAAPGRFLAKLRALATENKVKVLSDPHVMVRNNEEAVMNVGASIPVKRITGTGEDAIEDVEYRDIGIILTVTPQITMDGDVVMKIKQEISAVGQELFGDTGAASFTTREASTIVVTQDGYPLVLGGLIQNRDEKNVSGVPLLKDLPLVGRFFRYKSKKNERSDLFLLVTPRVVRSSDQGWVVTDDVLQRRVKQIEDWFNREETDADKIKQYLQNNFSIQD